MNIHFAVTTDDINNGKPEDEQSCALALSIERACRESQHPINDISVASTEIDIWIEETQYKAKHPYFEFIKDFDEQKPVACFEGDLIFEEYKDE